MKNTIKSFCLFVRDDSESSQIAEQIRKINSEAKKPLLEVTNENDADLNIAIGGDGTFIDSVSRTGFGKYKEESEKRREKIYAGVHTGTLGYLQSISKEEIFTFIKYISNDAEICVRKVFIATIKIYTTKDVFTYNALNDIEVTSSKLNFKEYFGGYLLQEITGNGFIVCTPTGSTALNMNAGGAIYLGDNIFLNRILKSPMRNKEITETPLTNNVITDNDITIILNHKGYINNFIHIEIDGNLLKINPKSVTRIDISMDKSNYINKFENHQYNVTQATRKKILGLPNEVLPKLLQSSD